MRVKSVEPKVQLWGYGYSLFALIALFAWKYLFDSTLMKFFCAPKVQYGFKGVPCHSSHCCVAFSTVLRGQPI